MIPESITINCASMGAGNKLVVIKAIRSLTGMGLMESKLVSERLDNQQINISTTLCGPSADPNAFLIFENYIKNLTDSGVEVFNTPHRILKSLRELGAQALMAGEDELANEILQLVLAEKLRRLK